MDQGQAAPPAQSQGQAAPPAQPVASAAPPVLPAPPLPPPPAVPAAPPLPAFALGPGRSHAVLNFDDPNTGNTATKLYNKAITLLEAKFDGEADNLAVFLASVRDRARCFNWHRLITVPIDDGTTRNLLAHYGQVSLENTRNHATTYINTPTRDAQDNDMFYYFLSDSLTNDFRTTVLLYADTYTVPVASALLKQIIILTRVDNPASTIHIRETLIESKQKLLILKDPSQNSIGGYKSKWVAFTHVSKKLWTYCTIFGRHTMQLPTRNSSPISRTSRVNVTMVEPPSQLRNSW